MSVGLVDQIRLGWIVLSESGSRTSSGVSTQQLTEIGPWNVLLGRDIAGTPSLLISVDESGPEETVGLVTVRNRELVTTSGPRNFVAVTCGDPALRDVFDHFLVSLVSALTEVADTHPGAVAIEILAHWKSLFRGDLRALGASTLGALLAELLVVEEVVGRDPDRSLETWTGPLEARHDLRRGAEAIEVKSTLSHTARQITVHGVDQLEPPAGGTLTLAWYRLEPVPGGPLSVFVVADRLIAAGVSAIALFKLLERAGCPPTARDENDAVRFEVLERRLFTVDQAFPRIVAASFPLGVPTGVDDLTYRSVLPDDSRALTVPQEEEVFRRMAGLP